MNKSEKFLFLKEIVKYDKPAVDLLLYAENKFVLNNELEFKVCDLSTDVWEQYNKETKEAGVFETLKKHLVQLQFPIQKNISRSKDYINSTLKGKKKTSVLELVLNEPDSLILEIHENDLIGKIPVLIINDDEDFSSIISALSNQNEPLKLPESMGAAFIDGFNNWDRIRRLKTNWLKNNSIESWNFEFMNNIIQKPYLYQDRLIILTKKPYSGVNCKLLGLSQNEWIKKSFQIRLYHECTHLFTLKKYGHMANNIHDEIIADYVGIKSVLPVFNKYWFLCFFGLEDYPNYRNGGRLENYFDHNKMSHITFDGLKTIIRRIADSIFEFDNLLGKLNSSLDHKNRIESICEVDLITMSSPNGTRELLNKYSSK